MVAQHLLQGIVEQVGGGVVGGTGLTQVGVDTGHELGLHVLGQRLHDVHALVVLALGVGDLDGLVLAHQHATVAYLTANLAIEGGVVEHQLVVGGLLLGHLAVAQDVAAVFGEVVAHKLLLALAQLHPVGVLDCGGIAGAGLLFLHLLGKLLLVDGVAMLAADELGEVERESVGVEQAEGLHAVEHGLAVGHQFVHGAIEQVDALVEGAQERLFLFFHHAADEVLLRGQFGI